MTTNNNGTKYFSEKPANLNKGEIKTMSTKENTKTVKVKSIARELKSYNSLKAQAVMNDTINANPEYKTLHTEPLDGYVTHLEAFTATNHVKGERSQAKKFLAIVYPKQIEAIESLTFSLNELIAKDGTKNSDGDIITLAITCPNVNNASSKVMSLHNWTKVTSKN